MMFKPDKNVEKATTNNIVAMIKSSGKTQRQIAAEMGVEEATVSAYVRGYSYPTLFTFKLLCEAVGCDYKDILGDLK